MPYINYGLISWGAACESVLNPLKIKIKQAVRLMAFTGRSHPSKPLFKQLNILDFGSCYKFECARFMYQTSKFGRNNVFENLFKPVNSIHKLNTRQASAGNLAQPIARTNFKSKFISVMGVKIWNETPVEIRQVRSKHIFAKKYKSWLINSC